MKLVRPKKFIGTKQDFYDWIVNKKLTYDDIAEEIFKKYGKKVNRSTAYRRAVEYGLDIYNNDRKWQNYMKKRRKKVKYRNILMVRYAEYFMDISEISYRRQFGNNKRSIKRYFLTLRIGKHKKQAPTYWAYLPSQKEKDIVNKLYLFELSLIHI